MKGAIKMEFFCPSLECLSVGSLLTHLNAALQRACPGGSQQPKAPFSTGTKGMCTRKCFGGKPASWEPSLNQEVISWGAQGGGCVTAAWT